uniref:Uncharacterized protein n=1 Tax=Strigamia maritima TaxID=126957 RepID=T1JI38_STRMM
MSYTIRFICTALQTATKIAYQTLMEMKNIEEFKQKEKELLLENINRQEDVSSPESMINQDGVVLILAGGDTTAPVEETAATKEKDVVDRVVSAPDEAGVREGSGDGDERKVEGAESEA